MDSFLTEVIAGLKATSPLEVVAVIFGLVYSLFAIVRSRWCWAAAFISSTILIYLSWISRLPMQASLQAYYVAMAIYGYWHWTREEGKATRAVTTWPLAYHGVAWAVVLIASLLSSRFLASYTTAAWPFLDSLTTWGSLVATWLMAQVKLENWLYWIVLDSIAVFLFAAQGLMFVALLFAVYLVVSAVGFTAWFRNWRAPVQQT